MLVAATAAIVAGGFPAAPAPAVTLAGPPLITLAFAGPAPGAVVIGWAKASNGGSSVTTYGFSLSVNGGATWSAVHSFASKNLVQTTGSFPSLVCTNTTPGSQGCLFRIHAANLLGFGPPSKPVGLWTVPGVPRALEAVADPDFATTALMWTVPKVNGGLAITGYDVLGSMDGAAPQLLTTVTATAATVPCTAKRTCVYSVRAINSHGKSPASSPATVTPAPGPPQGLTLQNTGSDSVTGRSVLNLGWTKPLTGLPADRYDVDVCGLRIGVPTSCDPQNHTWIGRTEVFPTSLVLTASANCQAGWMTCLMRVRA